jgi:CheY-like chemotaxis protein
MPKRILIVESDRGLSGEVRDALASRGLEVQETADGKKSIDLIRRSRPDLVILSVELASGQSGYIICGKLKKDDELNSIPVVIVGNPDGFVQHSKLKTRAEEYVPKPVDLRVLVERVGGLLGMPEPEPTADDSLTMDDVVEAEGDLAEEEISIDEATLDGDPELDMIDQAFDSGTSSAKDPPSEEPEEAPPEAAQEVYPAFADGEELADDATRSVEILGTSPADEAPLPADAHSEALAPSQADVEIRSLRAQLAALQRSLSAAQSRQNDAEERSRELEAQLESRGAELEAVASQGGKGEKEFFALREALNKKEKEVLLLSTGLRDKETEIVELRDHEVQLEQQLSESSVELARRDAQIKALTGRNEQVGVERKKLQEDLNETRNRLQARESEAEELRSRVNELDAALRQSQSEAAALRNQMDALQTAMNAAHREAQQTQARLSNEADSLRAQLDELKQRANKQDERLAKLLQRIKSQDKVRDKTKKALSIALQLLEEQASEEDEPAAA